MALSRFWSSEIAQLLAVLLVLFEVVGKVVVAVAEDEELLLRRLLLRVLSRLRQDEHLCSLTEPSARHRDLQVRAAAILLQI